MRAVNHDSLLLTLLLQALLDGLDALGIEVGAASATTKNDETVLVSGGSGNCGETLLGNAHEMMLGSRGSNGVNGNS